MPKAIKMFSKSLTDTDTKKRLAIPVKILPDLPDFNGSHAVKINLMYGTRVWPIVCSIRKKGYKKPVFSGGWRNFIFCNNFNVGDKLTLYKVQVEDGSSHYRVEVEKPATTPSAVLPPSALSLKHDGVDETTGTRKRLHFEHEQKQLPKADAPIKEEKAIMELADVAADDFVDHVISKPPCMIFGTNLSDKATSKAHYKTEQETETKFLGITMDTGMGKPSIHSHYMTKEEREIKSFGDLTKGGAMPSSTISQGAGKAYYKNSTEGLSLDLVFGQPTPYGSREFRFDFGAAHGGWRTRSTSIGLLEKITIGTEER